MYDNNVTYKVGINWKDLIIKLVMLVLFIIILLLLFPKANLDVFYDNVYSSNINTMKEAARNYYTIDRLPSKVGDKTSMTLKEMIDNHMLIRFTDKDGKTCNESTSYVEVTKVSNDEYTLKVQLNCGEQKDYILETIGCTTVCSNGSCQTIIVDEDSNKEEDTTDTVENNSQTNTSKDTVDAGSGDTSGDLKGNSSKTTYYQHKQEVVSTNTIYTCPEGYLKNGTKCTKTTTSATLDATPHYNPDQVITSDAKYNAGKEYKVYVEYIREQVGKDYSCPTGYTLNGVYCIKYTNATEVPGEVKYTCSSGYTLSGTKCVKTYDATYVAGAVTYTCPNGGTLSGKKCTITTNATANTTYTCPSGYTKNGSSCYKAYNATANTTYGTWVAKETQYYTTANKGYQNTTSWLQLSGMVSGAVCGSPCGGKGTWYKYTYYERSAKITYSCPDGGTLSGKKCTITTNATANTTYTCPSGYTKNGTKCTYTYNATEKVGAGSYTCPNGGTLSGTKCSITKDADKIVGDTTYTCPSGYTYNKTLKKCETKINATVTPEYSYTCPSGYTKTGEGTNTKCYKVIKGEGNYYCEDANATLSGSKCIKTIKGGISKYTCPSGYTLSGTKCSKTTTVTVDANKEIETDTSYNYKWSTSSKLDGWEFTGKTKVVEESYKAGQK